MHNIYYIILASVMVLQMYTSNYTAHKIDTSIRLINASMISDCVLKSSELNSYQYGIDYIALDQQMVKDLVNGTINDNLSFLNPTVKYYFYDKSSKQSCAIGVNECNSVQIKINLTYQLKEYERILRFEIQED